MKQKMIKRMKEVNEMIRTSTGTNNKEKYDYLKEDIRAKIKRSYKIKQKLLNSVQKEDVNKEIIELVKELKQVNEEILIIELALAKLL